MNYFKQGQGDFSHQKVIAELRDAVKVVATSVGEPRNLERVSLQDEVWVEVSNLSGIYWLKVLSEVFKGLYAVDLSHANMKKDHVPISINGEVM